MRRLTTNTITRTIFYLQWINSSYRLASMAKHSYKQPHLVSHCLSTYSNDHSASLIEQIIYNAQALKRWFWAYWGYKAGPHKERRIHYESDNIRLIMRVESVTKSYRCVRISSMRQMQQWKVRLTSIFNEVPRSKVLRPQAIYMLSHLSSRYAVSMTSSYFRITL